jgi:hypothetical protein
MVLRKVRDARDAEACLAEAESSGLERAAWAHANGVSARSLNAWRLILARRARREAAGLRLVELVAEPEPARTPIVVRCGAFSIELGGDFDERTLGRVLTVVASC